MIYPRGEQLKYQVVSPETVYINRTPNPLCRLYLYEKNLLFTGPDRPQLGFASLFLRFLFSRFPGLEEKGWIRPGREWGCGSGESEFVERSSDFGRGWT